METRDTILHFWFGRDGDDREVARRQAGLWWGKSDATDAVIRERFESTLLTEADGTVDWSDAPGLLARVILLDQFPRNIYRGTPRAFAFDERARELANEALASGHDARLRRIERVFLYLPFEHSESLADQETSIRLYERLHAEAEDDERALFADYLDYARRHKAIVDRFGRYPHRNAILGRESTPEELAFLETPGSSF